MLTIVVLSLIAAFKYMFKDDPTEKPYKKAGEKLDRRDMTLTMIEKPKQESRRSSAHRTAIA